MTNKRSLALFLSLCLLLTGCSVPEHPDTAADGTPWGSDWTNVGAVLGVEPLADWTSQRSEDLLADVGTYFAAWTWGEPQRTAEGETSYRAQIFLILSVCESAEEAGALTAQWQAAAENAYRTEAPRTLEHRLGKFTLTDYTFQGEAPSFDQGLAAMAVVGKTAVNIEIATKSDTGIDLDAAMQTFLDACHFAP